MSQSVSVISICPGLTICFFLVYQKASCSISDSACVAAYYDGVIKKAAESGFPEIGIPILDPYVVKNMNMTILGLIKVDTPEGTVKGLKTCRSNLLE